MVVFRLASLDSENFQPFGEVLVVGHDHATVAETTQILAGEKGEATDVAHAAGASSIPILGADGLSRILDDGQPAFRGNLKNWIHIGALTVQVHGNDGPG